MFELVTPPHREELQLQPASHQQTEHFLHNVISGITRARLQALTMVFAPLFGCHRIILPETMSLLTQESVWKLLRGLTPPTLEQTRMACAALFANPDNVRMAFSRLPRAYARTFEIIFNSVFISSDTIRDLIEDNLDKIMLPGKSGTPVENFVSFDGIAAMLQRVSQYYGTEYFTIEFSLLRYLGEIMSTGLFAHPVPRCTDVLPDEPLTVFSCADSLISLLPALEKAARKEDIEVASTTGVAKVGAVKLFTLTHPVAEFFPDCPVRQLREMRMRTCMSMINAGFYRYKQYSTDNPANTLKDILNNVGSDTYLHVSLALPYFTNLRKGYFQGSEFGKVKQYIVEYLKSLAIANRGEALWIDAADMARNIFTRLSPQTRYVANLAELTASMRHVENAIDGSALSRLNVVNGFAIPAIYGMMALLCACGIIDMATAPIVAGSPTPLDAIRYVRLSDFGRYFCDMVPEYTAIIEPAVEKPRCELDPERLIITALSDEAAAIIKTQFGEPIGAGRFQVTEHSFFRKAHNRKLFDSQVERLRELAGITDFPGVWNNFFRAMSMRYTAIRGRSLSALAMFEINPECPGLADLLTSDPDIRNLIRLVEGNSFLIMRNDLPALAHELQRHGYPMPGAADSYYPIY